MKRKKKSDEMVMKRKYSDWTEDEVECLMDAYVEHTSSWRLIHRLHSGMENAIDCD